MDATDVFKCKRYQMCNSFTPIEKEQRRIMTNLCNGIHEMTRNQKVREPIIRKKQQVNSNHSLTDEEIQETYLAHSDKREKPRVFRHYELRLQGDDENPISQALERKGVG